MRMSACADSVMLSVINIAVARYTIEAARLARVMLDVLSRDGRETDELFSAG